MSKVALTKEAIKKAAEFDTAAEIQTMILADIAGSLAIIADALTILSGSEYEEESDE